MLIVVTIALGVFFRFFHLDRKVVWSDEVFTELHVSGVTEAELVARAGRFSDVRSLRAYVAMGLDRPSDHLRATIDTLVDEDPQHAPLFYLLERVWVGAFGDSVTVERALPATIGVLALPFAYWLALELFGSVSCAWTFVALIAISPYFVLYSQENREYSLWALALLALSASALRALRLKTPAAWTVYAASVAFAAYTDILSLAVVGGQVAFVVIAERRNGVGKGYALASFGVGLALVVPWLIVLESRRAQIAHGLASTVGGKNSFAKTLRTFFGEWHLATIDFNSVEHSALGLIVSVAALVGICVAFVAVKRYASSRATLFMACVSLASLVPILGADLAFGGHRSSNPRYLAPLFECIELALAFALTWAASRNVAWKFGIASVAFCGIASCAASSVATTWWTKYNEQSIALAAVINRSSRPIIVSDNYVHFVLSLAPYLRPETRVLLAPRCFLCHAPEGRNVAVELGKRIGPDGTVFLLGPSRELVDSIRERRAILAERVRCIDVEGNCSSDLRLF